MLSLEERLRFTGGVLMVTGVEKIRPTPCYMFLLMKLAYCVCCMFSRPFLFSCAHYFVAMAFFC